ncbi:CBM35 domain-containing protein [Clostridium thermosuccinogenes]|uniref:CBM35 domain-containing protein n=1 Tax=Clostridium thermosuccinogenes TaxID=84032 RepID=UPI00137ADE6A|nr:CBM35 domain-containing protein [Pseudoclostridium thermosuccinogenes]
MNIKKCKITARILTVTLLVFILASTNAFNTISAYAVTYPENTYEAETATLNNVTVNTNHPGYTGTGFVDGYGEIGDYVQFNITVATEGDYTLRFRYSNNTGNYNKRSVLVDGVKISNAYFPDNGSWDSWSTTDVGTTLSAGTHTVRVLVESSSDGFINLDNLVVTPKHVSVRSLYLSNWSNMMALWQASHLADNDTISTKGPRLSELRYSGKWTVNQIHDYSSFFRNETDGVKYNQVHDFDSEGYFTEDGVLHNNYLKYNGSYIPNLEISKDYVMVPNQNFIVVRYSLTNTGNTNLNYSILDMLHPNNTTSNNVTAYYDSARKALIVDMSASGQPYLALGAFETPTYYQVANDADSNLSSSTCSPWYTFDNDGTLKNNSSVTTKDPSVGFVQNVTVAANSTSYVYFYLALGTSQSNIQSIIDTARANTGSYWFDYTKNIYNNWFSGKTIPEFSDADLTTVIKRNLVMIKNCIRPGNTTEDGAFPATTNPYNYSSKVWARDSAVTALALDAAGFTAEAGTYWKWLAARQAANGTFETCYWLWDNTDANFVEPEYDSMGIFLVGVYRHYLATNDNAFLDSVYNAVKKTANFIMNNINLNNGFGPEDKSIWEEGDYSQYYTYTQAAYAAGLRAAAWLAQIKGEPALADSYNGASSTIMTAINRDDTDIYKGLWNVNNGYYNRCINTDNTANTLMDTSTNILFALGVIDVNSSRARSHIAKMETMAADTYGLPRYAGDTFYYTSPWSPCGNEALEAAPSWPQMTMWNAIYQIYTGNTAKAYEMLKWFKNRTATGFMVTGECISNVTKAPCVSTASEPVTAAAYILACLAYANNYDTRVYASESNAGCYKSINVTPGASSDWSQYQYVPYYVDSPRDGVVSDPQTDIQKVYICNDNDNIYIRINNVAGTLPGFGSDNFEMTVYTDFNAGNVSTTTNSRYGTNLGRNLTYMFTRRNSDTGYSKYAVNNGNWVFNKNITSVIEPQWDTSTGGIEIVIPRSEIGSPANGAWGHFVISLGRYANGTWSDQDFLKLNYRLTGSTDSWLYGNFE